jgi:hypothetical protein
MSGIMMHNMSHKAGAGPAQVVYNLDAANFSAVPSTGATDATGNFTLTVSNTNSRISWNSANLGVFRSTYIGDSMGDFICGGPDYSAGGQSYTIFVAYKLATTTTGRLINTNNETNGDFVMGGYNGKPKVYYTNGVTINLSGETADTVWHMDWAVFNSTTGVGSIYSATNNQPLSYAYTATNASIRGPNQLRLFNRASGTEASPGDISVVKVWNGALTLAQIQAEWAAYYTRYYSANPSSGYYFAVCVFGVNTGVGLGFDIQTTTAYSIPSGFTFVNNATFDPNYNGAGNVLSNGNLSVKNKTTNNTTVTTYPIGINDKVIMSFKYIFTGNWPAPDNTIFGIAKQSISSTVSQWPGSLGNVPATYSAGIYDDGRTLISSYLGTVQDFNAGTRRARIYSPNDIIDVAVDAANQKMWFRVNGNPWMATYSAPTVSVGADPATNAGGFDITNINIQNFGKYMLVVNGTNQYLSVTPTAASSTATIEGWYYSTAAAMTTQNQGLFGWTGSAAFFQAYFNTAGALHFTSYGGSNNTTAATGSGYTPAVNAWVHYAFTWNSTDASTTTYTAYVNGYCVGTATGTGANNGSGNPLNGVLTIGQNSTYYWKGNIRDFRVSNNLRYTGSTTGTNYFTPPSRGTVQKDSNTLALISLPDSTLADSSSNMLTVANTGSVSTITGT